MSDNLKYRIFIVEDDFVIAETVAKSLVSWGFDTRRVEDFQHVLAEFEEYQPHLVLMDISLPFFNGYHWCTQIRKISKVPIVFVSSANDKMNIVMAINMGGDDFVTKPFEIEVLTAKISAIFRRSYDYIHNSDTICCNDSILNTNDATLTFGTEKIDLTRNEYRILYTLMQNKGKIVSRDALIRALWETDCYIDENTLSVNVARLRKKTDAIGLTNFINTKKGLGYIVE